MGNGDLVVDCQVMVRHCGACFLLSRKSQSLLRRATLLNASSCRAARDS
jgi:hypothetical protein